MGLIPGNFAFHSFSLIVFVGLFAWATNSQYSLSDRVASLEVRVQNIGRALQTTVQGSSVATSSEVSYTVGNLQQKCRSPYGEHSCLDVNSEPCEVGSFVSNYCDGPSNIRCCVPQSCGNGGQCIDTFTSACAGDLLSGLCPGGYNIKCCQPSGTGSSGAPEQTAQVPFAPSTGIYWPVRSQSGAADKTISYRDVSGNFHGGWGRQFLASRSNNRYHSGIDLYAEVGDYVVATEAGTVVNAYYFYSGTDCIIVQHDSGTVINYGEVGTGTRMVEIGERVQAGQQLARIGRMESGSHMLHFETYTSGTTANIRSYVGDISPRLRNPTQYLLDLSARGT